MGCDGNNSSQEKSKKRDMRHFSKLTRKLLDPRGHGNSFCSAMQFSIFVFYSQKDSDGDGDG